jgi:hypothetical protein
MSQAFRSLVYVYTIEAFDQYLDHLRPGGYLAITRWLKLPPRDSLRLFATAVSALERRGIGEPGRQLALVRSWNTTTLLVKNGQLTGQDMQKSGVSPTSAPSTSPSSPAWRARKRTDSIFSISLISSMVR